MTPQRMARLNDLMAVIYQRGGGLSRREIGQAVGLKKTPYLADLLAQAVADQYLRVELDTSCYPVRLRYYPVS